MSAKISTILRPEETKSPSASLRIFGPDWARITRYFVRRAAIARLRELDDDALKDIGLARSEIQATAYGHMIASNRRRI
ncbi:MAG: DUF1127 domain-containing protein [Ensifer alkalisoli]|nr:DUF1127 domain-containing protein [Sinorhizobium alkalisoli]